MYKVFINDKPIILTDSTEIVARFKVYDFNEGVIDEITHKLERNRLKGAILFSNNLVKDWKIFLSHFTVIKAAGGLVVNQHNEFLFIYRTNRWDLPKGRIEPGEKIKETAVREVQEECGLPEIDLNDFLLTTYHLFHYNKEFRLKETHWFLMHTTYKGKLTPQLEEGITKVAFKNKNETSLALQNTYANIKLVFDVYNSISK